MRRIIAALALAVLTLPLHAQRTTRTVANPTTEFDDSKPNSADVPDVYATTSGAIRRYPALSSGRYC